MVYYGILLYIMVYYDILWYIVQTLRTNELKVWTVLSTDDIYSI